MEPHPTIQHLRQQGYRITPQRLAVLQILRQADDHLTAVEVFQRARQTMPGITEATVYRSLNFLVSHGLALAAHLGGNQLAYEFADRHHHHLICRQCGQSIEIDHHMLDELYQKLEQTTGFAIDSLHMTFFGLCPDCRT